MNAAAAAAIELGTNFARPSLIEVEAADSAAGACSEADVVVTCAPWPPRALPSLGRDAFAPGTFVGAIDYDSSVSVAAAASFDRRFTDDVAQMKQARAKGSFTDWPDDFGEIHSATRTRGDETILCANLGLAIFDLAVASAVLRFARDRGLGTELPSPA